MKPKQLKTKRHVILLSWCTIWQLNNKSSGWPRLQYKTAPESPKNVRFDYSTAHPQSDWLTVFWSFRTTIRWLSLPQKCLWLAHTGHTCISMNGAVCLVTCAMDDTGYWYLQCLGFRLLKSFNYNPRMNTLKNRALETQWKTLEARWVSSCDLRNTDVRLEQETNRIN